MDVYVGEIRLFPYTFIPRGWLPCNGAIYPREGYEKLNALLGNRYGGTENKDFAVPDLIGTEPHPCMRYCIAQDGYWPPRN